MLIVAYDPVDAEKRKDDYEALDDLIASLAPAKRIQKSVWVMASSADPGAINDRIMGQLRDNDKVFGGTLFNICAYGLARVSD
jgi:hypothetical protein